MVGFILCLWFNLDMVSPSSPNHPKGFCRIALVGKYQADGIADHLHELAKLALGRGCEVFIEAETAKNTQINDYPHKKIEDFAGSIDLAIVLGGDGTMLGIGR
jgi:NAD+ kinase